MNIPARTPAEARRLSRIATKCCGRARLTNRSKDASRNELYTAIAGHDCPLVALGPASTDQTAYTRGVK